MKIGIIGLGVVGEAVQEGLIKLGNEVVGYDIKFPETSLQDVLSAEVVFLCVPTPSASDGSCDTSIVEHTVDELSSSNYKGLVTIKSTVEPGTTDRLSKKHPNLRLAFCPEFLREKYAKEDFLENQDICAIGAYSEADADLLRNIHLKIAKEIVVLRPIEAEAVKYFTNAFNAVRVLFSSSFYELCKVLGISYDNVKNTAIKRYNIDDHYLDCNDQLLGFGGKCLPKDVMTLAALSKRILPENDFFQSLIRENGRYKKLFMRPDKPSRSILILTQKVDENDFDLWFFTRWISTFAKYFQNVKVICLSEGPHETFPENVEVVSLGKEKGNSRLVQAWNLYKYLWRFLPQIDGVFIHMNQIYAILGWPLYFFFGKKRILWYNHRTINWDVKLAVCLVDAVVTASPDTFPYATPKRISTGHGIDTNFYRPLDSKSDLNKMTVLSTGRITPTKNQLLMCQAMKLLRDQGHQDIHLDIYGQPALESDKIYYQKIEEYIAREKLQDYIRLMGRAENHDMPNTYNSHNLFLNLARNTGTDKAVLEAMACGLNILTSNQTFKAMLPPEHFLEDSKPETVAKGILSFMDKKEKNASLREIVVKQNNLDDLVQRFYDILS